MRSPLQSARLRKIIAAYTINRLGTWFGVIALMVAVYDHTHSALAVAGLLLAAQALPAFVVPALVARVEGSARQNELSALYFFEAVTTAAIAVLLWHFWLPAILLLAALDGTAALAASALLRAEVARTARQGVQASLDEAGASADEEAHEAERKANGALTVAFSTTFVIGPVVAGAVVAAAGAPAALFIDVGSFIVCGALLKQLRPSVKEAIGESMRSRLRATWQHVNDVPAMRALLLVNCAALVFYESAAPIEVTYAKATLHAGDRGFGLLLTTWGVGSIVGSVVFARSVRSPLIAMLSAGAFAIAIADIGFALAPSLALACAAALVGGLGNGVELPALISVVQRRSPPQLHAQMMGAVESLNALCVAIGLPIGGGLVALSSPRIAFVVIGAGTAASAAGLLSVGRGRPATSADEREPDRSTAQAAGRSAAEASDSAPAERPDSVTLESASN